MSNRSSDSVITTTLLYDSTMTDMSGHQALVFGELVRMVVPTLAQHHSDLYYDAIALQDNMSGRFYAFHFSFNESGTYFTNAAGPVHRIYRANHFLCAVHLRRHSLRLSMQRLSEQPAVRCRVGDVVRLMLPHSEVCAHMQVAGEARWVRVLGDMAEILGLAGARHSLVTHGEAGLLRDGDDFLFAPPTEE